MSLIEAVELTKQFRIAVKSPGLRGALRHLFAPRYETRNAVDRLDLSIEPGERVAYVGPNGAGKSTTIKMLTGILVPTSGRLQVNGIVPHRRRIENARTIGVVFGQRTQLWWDLAVRDSLALQRKLYEIPSAVFRENLDRFTKLLALDEFLHLAAPQPDLPARLASLSGVVVEADDDRHYTLRFDRFSHPAGNLMHEVMRHASVNDFHLEEPSIEQVIRQVYAGRLLEPETMPGTPQ
jgi:ABC-type uncharacterized transport system ATPase subunit